MYSCADVRDKEQLLFYTDSTDWFLLRRGFGIYYDL